MEKEKRLLPYLGYLGMFFALAFVIGPIALAITLNNPWWLLLLLVDPFCWIGLQIVNPNESVVLVQVREIIFLGLKLGYRFRISKPDQLKPELLKLERVLIYGRPPELDTHLLIILLGISEQIKTLFASSENKRRARERFKELSKLPPAQNPETYTIIIKKLQEALRAKRAARS